MIKLKLKGNERLHIGDDITLHFEWIIDPIREPIKGSTYCKEISVAINVPWDVNVAREEKTGRQTTYRQHRHKD